MFSTRAGPSRLLLNPTPLAFLGEVMADRSVDLSALPKEVRDQFAELDLELSEGKGGDGRGPGGWFLSVCVKGGGGG